jgi:3-oxoacyl-[acyl-carrier protein] reductase
MHSTPTSPTSSRFAALVSAIADRLGSIDVLVLNATGAQPEAQLADVAWADHLEQLDFFVKSPVLLGRAVLPHMMAKGFGRIVNIDSEVVDRPPPGRTAYTTAKNAQIGLARSWARELAPARNYRQHGRARLRARGTPRGRPS